MGTSRACAPSLTLCADSSRTGTGVRSTRSAGLSAVERHRRRADSKTRQAQAAETLERAAESTVFILHALGYTHLRARGVGKSVVIEPGPMTTPCRMHA
jgi:hypothetical protein